MAIAEVSTGRGPVRPSHDSTTTDGVRSVVGPCVVTLLTRKAVCICGIRTIRVGYARSCNTFSGVGTWAITAVIFDATAITAVRGQKGRRSVARLTARSPRNAILSTETASREAAKAIVRSRAGSTGVTTAPIAQKVDRAAA